MTMLRPSVKGQYEIRKFYHITCYRSQHFLGVGNGNGSDLRFQIITDAKVTLEKEVNDKLGQKVCIASNQRY